MKLSVFCSVAGLKAGDEILEINNRAVGTLSSSVLRDFLLQPSLGLLVRTRPTLEGGAPPLESPPHRAEGPGDPGQSPLAFLAGSPGKAGTAAQGRAPELVLGAVPRLKGPTLLLAVILEEDARADLPSRGRG